MSNPYKEFFGRTYEEHRRGWQLMVAKIRETFPYEYVPDPPLDPVCDAVEAKLERFKDGEPL